MNIQEFLKDRRAPVAVIRDDTGEKVAVHPAFLVPLTADTVRITVPGKEGTGRIVPMDELAN